jgi:hypothetical protein
MARFGKGGITVVVIDGPWIVAAPVTGLAVFCAVHLLSSRLWRFTNPYRPVQLGCVVGLAATVAESWIGLARVLAGPGDSAALVTLNSFCYFAFAYGYFGFVNLNLTSLRIRILAEMLDCGGELPASELLARYAMDHVAAIRVGRLIAGKHLLERGGRIYSGRRLLLFVAGVIRMLQRAILGSASVPTDAADQMVSEPATTPPLRPENAFTEADRVA